MSCLGQIMWKTRMRVAPQDRRGGKRGKRNVAGNCAREAQCSRKLREGSVTWQEIARGKHNVAGKRKLREGSATWQEIARGKHNVAGKGKLREGSATWQEIARGKHNVAKLHEGSVMWQEVMQEKHNVEIAAKMRHVGFRRS
jgi:hypothetical protein